MLILTRRPGERVVIGDEVLVTVMSVSGHTVRLGIAAPQGVPIYREEIWLAVKEENRAAAESTDELPSAPPGAAAVGQAPAGGQTPAEGPTPEANAADSADAGETSAGAPLGEQAPDPSGG
jgi:carbon storage regulator